MRNGNIHAAIMVLLVMGTPAWAEPIGATLKVVNQVTAQFNRDTRTLIEGDGVSQDEVIAVGSDALSELVFKDETKLALGPGSQVKLDKFVYDPDKTNGSIAVNLIKGTFRFMTGVASKPTYVIRTPSASITVRGTIFDVYVFADGSTWLLLHEGAVTVSNLRGKCHLHDTPGRLIRVTADGDVGVPVNWDDMPDRDSVAFDDAFPFVAKPPSMDPNPIYTRAAILDMPPADSRRSMSCDGTNEEPAKREPQQRAGDDDPPKVRKAVRRVPEDDEPARKPAKRVDYDDERPKYKPKKPVQKAEEDKPVYKPKPPKVVVYDKPRKPKRPPRDNNYDGENVAKAAAALAIIGIVGGIALSKGGGGYKGGGGFGGGGGGGGGGYGGH